ncbi:MAG TPA: hypothetical protein VHR27_17835, partial [Blastocatellia bacterium]|nr:hypothetical protein [Blastocatellia bacterium]
PTRLHSRQVRDEPGSQSSVSIETQATRRRLKLFQQSHTYARIEDRGSKVEDRHKRDDSIFYPRSSIFNLRSSILNQRHSE